MRVRWLLYSQISLYVIVSASTLWYLGRLQLGGASVLVQQARSAALSSKSQAAPVRPEKHAASEPGRLGGPRLSVSGNCSKWTSRDLPADLLVPGACDVLRHTSPAGRLGSQARGLPLHKATFLYLGQGSHRPSAYMEARGCFPESLLFFLTFNSTWTPPSKASCRYESVFFPNSTWTGGRNELLRQGCSVEARQGWKFEYFIFFDNDVHLIPAKMHKPKGEDGEMLFRRLLLQFRPLRAGVGVGDLPLPPLPHDVDACAKACFTDANVEAYHRTAVQLFLPYDAFMDNTSWWMSGYIQNLRLASLAARHCAIFRQVTMNRTLQLSHADYPRGTEYLLDGCDWKTTRLHFYRCLHDNSDNDGRGGGLGDQRVPLLANEILARYRSGLYGVRENKVEEPCAVMAEGVDYANIIHYPATKPMR